ncbi:UDP-3-O-acylglucosamine N-acyltransferase [Saliniradius amylolyticus]|uniref:UDP-3-O-acylglucosamine N-acyltransferase n=1 Tax=Saliniradius amylolyticus TaxID=2183582 RepID=A0A2S2E1W2_9ALTE|nr:acetyltransferase [Saliniradius amylolyticus]AWL11628.1 UDP-3-O-acylglucosamine N-acyltransferase [Saliniradius amylolyticus]
MNKPLVLLGAGGHAKVVAELLAELSLAPDYIISPAPPTFEFQAVHLTDDDALHQFKPDEVILINGLGALPGQPRRYHLFEQFTAQGYTFMTLISPLAHVSPSAQLEQGVQIMHGAIIQAAAHIGRNSIINTGAIVEHDCHLGAHNHIAPGVTLSGEVKTGHYVHIGTGANIIQQCHIGDRTVIGAGATVVKSVTADKKMYAAMGTVRDHEE